MKYIAALLFFLSFSAIASSRYQIDCKQGDCFSYGWSMKELKGDFSLENKCIANDCRNNGWQSIDSKGDQFFVNCLGAGCFIDGWMSYNVIGAWVGEDTPVFVHLHSLKTALEEFVD